MNFLFSIQKVTFYGKGVVKENIYKGLDIFKDDFNIQNDENVDVSPNS